MTSPPRLRALVRERPLLAARILAWSLVLRPAKHVIPLPRLVRLARSRRARPLDAEQRRSIARLTSAVPELRPIRGRDNCLERSLLAYRYLSAAGARPELVSGVSRRPGGVAGHVWVLVDGEPVHDRAEDLAEWVPVVRFGPDGERRERP